MGKLLKDILIENDFDINLKEFYISNLSIIKTEPLRIRKIEPLKVKVTIKNKENLNLLLQNPSMINNELFIDSIYEFVPLDSNNTALTYNIKTNLGAYLGLSEDIYTKNQLQFDKSKLLSNISYNYMKNNLLKTLENTKIALKI